MNRNHYFILLGIAFLYILTRIIVSIRFPLFFDEAIYIHWAQYIMDDWFWWHVSLTDGKQPLFIWLISIFHRFISDPILAGRFVSVIAGLGSMIGTFLVVKELFGYKTGLIAVILYSIVPFYLLYDSLALMDSLLMTESIFAVYFSLKLTHSFRLRYALLLGITIGLGLLTKSSASFFLYLLPIGVLLFTKYSLRKSLIFFGFLLLSGVIAKGIESTLRMSTYYSVIQSKNNEFVRSLSEVLQDPFTLAMQNGSMIGEWVLDYMGLFLILFALAAFLFRKKTLVLVYFLLLSVVPIMTMVLFGKQMYPRHFLFMTWPLIVLAAYTIAEIYEYFWSTRLRPLIYCIPLVFIGLLYKDFLLLSNPSSAPLVEIERWQFFEGEPSGVGQEKLISFFEKKAEKELLILTDKPLGILPDGIAIHFFRNQNVHVFGTDSLSKDVINRYIQRTTPDEVYVVLSWQDAISEVTADKVLEVIRNGERNKNWRVYKIKIRKGKV